MLDGDPQPRRAVAGTRDDARVRQRCAAALAHPTARTRFWSQYGQDFVLWTQHYQFQQRDQPFVYVE